MAETIDFRLGRVPDIRLPIGANFSAAFAFTGIDLTGYTATLAAKASGKDQLSAWSKSGITVGATSIAFDISPATLDDNSVPFAVATSGYLTGYSLTVYDSGSVVMRIQGDVEWIPETGDFATTTAASSDFSVAVSAALTPAITVTGGREVELRTNLGRLEWRYVGGSTWTDLGAVGAGGSMSAAEILAALLTVDGANSTLDADTLDGIQAAGFATAAAASTAQSTADAAVSDAAAALAEGQSASTGAGTALSLATQADTNATAAKAKTDFITVTQAVDLDTMESDIAGKAATSHTHGTAGIDDAAVTLVKLADLGAGTVLGRPAGAGTGPVVALTALQQRAASGLATTDAVTFAGLTSVGASGNFTVSDGSILDTTRNALYLAYSRKTIDFNNGRMRLSADGTVTLSGSDAGFSLADRNAVTGNFTVYSTNGKLRFFNGSDLFTLAETTGDMVVSGSVKTPGYLANGITTVASLLAAATYPRYRIWVSDSTVAASGNFAAIVGGGGGNTVEVKSNGTNWVIC